MKSQRVMTLQFRNINSLTSSAGGVIQGQLGTDPSVTTAAPFGAVTLFTEWTNVAALFAQVKCVQFEVRIFPTGTDEVKGDVQPMLAVGSSLGDASAPSSYQAVLDNGDSQIYPIYLDTTARGRYHSLRHKGNLQWATTGNPNPSTSIYAGCPGSLGFFGNGFPASTNVATLHICGTYKLRMRV